MSPTQRIATIDLCREQLAETRRWVRTRPATAMMILRGLATNPDVFGDRLTDNLCVGLDAIQACPNVTEGYIDGASWELAIERSQLEKLLATEVAA